MLQKYSEFPFSRLTRTEFVFHVFLFYVLYLKGSSAWQIHERIQGAFGDGCPSLSVVRWKPNLNKDQLSQTDKPIRE